MERHYGWLRILLIVISVLSLIAVMYFSSWYKFFLPEEITHSTNKNGEVSFTIPEKGMYAFPEKTGRYIKKITQNGKEIPVNTYKSNVYSGRNTHSNLSRQNPTYSTFQADKGTVRVFAETNTENDKKEKSISFTLSKHVNKEYYFTIMFISLFIFIASSFALFTILGKMNRNKYYF